MNNKLRFGFEMLGIMVGAVAISTAAYRLSVPDEPSFPTDKVMEQDDGKFPLTVDN